MHSRTLLLSLFAAGALASPVKPQHKHKREVVTDVEIVTEIVYVTSTHHAGKPKPAKTKNPDNKPVIVTTTVGANKPANPPPTPYNSEPAPAPPSPKPQPPPHKPKKPQPDPDNEPSGNSFAAKVVRHHNVHRSNHSAPAISWDQGLAATAAKIAATCVYEHNTDMDGGGYGQNIAAGVPSNRIASVITDLFYNGELALFGDQWGNPNPVGFESWGHFSQVIWKDTSHVGCATHDCSATGLANVGGGVQSYFTVCNYKSPGNFVNEYGDNVGEPLGHATVTV